MIRYIFLLLLSINISTAIDNNITNVDIDKNTELQNIDTTNTIKKDKTIKRKNKASISSDVLAGLFVGATMSLMASKYPKYTGTVGMLSLTYALGNEYQQNGLLSYNFLTGLPPMIIIYKIAEYNINVKSDYDSQKVLRDNIKGYSILATWVYIQNYFFPYQESTKKPSTQISVLPNNQGGADIMFAYKF